MNILVTGTTSGLGKYAAIWLSQNHQVIEWDRNNFGDVRVPINQIVHCAHDKDGGNISMLKRLRCVPTQSFVYVSSIDVYQQDDANEYARQKRACEAYVRMCFSNHLIVRPSMMIGSKMRKNTIVRMLLGEPLTLTADSTVSCVHYFDVLQNWPLLTTPVVDFVADILTLGEIADHLSIKPQWGSYKYTTPLCAPNPAFRNTLNTIKHFRDYELAKWKVNNEA